MILYVEWISGFGWLCLNEPNEVIIECEIGILYESVLDAMSHVNKVKTLKYESLICNVD